MGYTCPGKVDRGNTCLLSVSCVRVQNKLQKYFVRMPYTEATILEVMRYKTLLPFVMRRTLQDTEVGGYFVPCGTTVCTTC